MACFGATTKGRRCASISACRVPRIASFAIEFTVPWVKPLAASAPRKASSTIIQPVRANRGPSRKCGAYPNFRGISFGQDMVRSSNSSRKLPGNFQVSQSLDSAIAFVVTKLGRYPRRLRQWASSMQLPADSQRVARAPAAEVCAQIPCSESSEGIAMPLGLDCDPAQLGELVDRRAAAEPAITAGFHPTEGNLGFVLHGRTVDVADA